ncbi:Glycosyl_transferase family 2 protein [Hexamita inflata]|uniref:Glycosyl transferase family 2 protein n=1 Tax=Hexamita inflata TaxID=28002 RepID=A0AA86QDY8_9EUKA|nr:Glycosyl transferase family 2 protein [Hexamita inflata]
MLFLTRVFLAKEAKKPLVSVIIPFYNEAAVLKTAIKSAQNQTLRDIEIICVDDGSTDSSVIFVEILQKKDDRIVLVKSKKNKGLVNARAEGIAKARADHILFLDADDFFFNNSIAELSLQKALETNADVVHFKEQRQITKKDGSITIEYYEWANPVIFDVVNSPKVMEYFLLQGNGSTMHGKLITKAIYLKALNYMGKDLLNMGLTYSEDTLIMGTIFLLLDRYVGLDVMGYTYIIRAAAWTFRSKTNFELTLDRQRQTLIVYRRMMEKFPTEYHQQFQHIVWQTINYHVALSQKFNHFTEANIRELCQKYIDAKVMNSRDSEYIQQQYCPATKAEL